MARMGARQVVDSPGWSQWRAWLVLVTNGAISVARPSKRHQQTSSWTNMRDIAHTAGVLESILDDILRHDARHPNHGVGCSCHDRHAQTIRRLLLVRGFDTEAGSKSRRNLAFVLGYVARDL